MCIRAFTYTYMYPLHFTSPKTYHTGVYASKYVHQYLKNQ